MERSPVVDEPSAKRQKLAIPAGKTINISKTPIINISKTPIMNVGEDESTIFVEPDLSLFDSAYDAFSFIRYIDSVHDFGKFFKTKHPAVLFPVDTDKTKNTLITKQNYPGITKVSHSLKQTENALKTVISQDNYSADEVPEYFSILKSLTEIKTFSYLKYPIFETSFEMGESMDSINEKLERLSADSGPPHYSKIYKFRAKKSVITVILPYIIDMLKNISLIPPEVNMVGVYDTFKISKSILEDSGIKIKNIISDNIDSATSVSEQLVPDKKVVYTFPFYIPFNKETVSSENPLIFIRVIRNGNMGALGAGAPGPEPSFCIQFIYVTDMSTMKTLEGGKIQIPTKMFGFEKEQVRLFYENIFKPNKRGLILFGENYDIMRSKLYGMDILLGHLSNELKIGEKDDKAQSHFQKILQQALFGFKEIGDKSRMYDVLALNKLDETNPSVRRGVNRSKIAYPNILVSQDFFIVNWAYQLNNIPVIFHTKKASVDGDSEYVLDFFIPGVERGGYDEAMIKAYNSQNKKQASAKYVLIQNKIDDLTKHIDIILGRTEDEDMGEPDLFDTVTGFDNNNACIIEKLQLLMEMEVPFSLVIPEQGTRAALHNVQINLSNGKNVTFTSYQFIFFRFIVYKYLYSVVYFSMMLNIVKNMKKIKTNIEIIVERLDENKDKQTEIKNIFVFLYYSVSHNENVNLEFIFENADTNIYNFVYDVKNLLDLMFSTEKSQDDFFVQMNIILSKYFNMSRRQIDYLRVINTSAAKNLNIKEQLEDLNSFNNQVVSLLSNMDELFELVKTAYNNVTEVVGVLISSPISHIISPSLFTDEIYSPDIMPEILNGIGYKMPDVNVMFAAKTSIENLVNIESTQEYISGAIGVIGEYVFKKPVGMEGGSKSSPEFIKSLYGLNESVQKGTAGDRYMDTLQKLYKKLYKLNQMLTREDSILFNTGVTPDEVEDVFGEIMYSLQDIQDTVIYETDPENKEIVERSIGIEVIDEYLLKFVNHSRDENTGLFGVSDDLFLFYIINTRYPLKDPVIQYQKLKKDNNITRDTMIKGQFTDLFDELLKTHDPLEYMYCPITLIDVYGALGQSLNTTLLDILNPEWREITLEGAIVKGKTAGPKENIRLEVQETPQQQQQQQQEQQQQELSQQQQLIQDKIQQQQQQSQAIQQTHHQSLQSGGKSMKNKQTRRRKQKNKTNKTRRKRK